MLAATNGAQRPHEYHSLVGEHYLTRTLATDGSVTVSAAMPAAPAPTAPPRPDPPEIDVTELQIAALRELAETGDAEAQHEMAERYENGRGVGRDIGVARPDGTCRVGTSVANAAGLSDMVGNVQEWTQGCWEGDCGHRVLRGGSFRHFGERLHPGGRSGYDPGSRTDFSGFRVLRTLD